MIKDHAHIWTFGRFLLVGGSFSLGYALMTAGFIRFANAPALTTSVIVYLLCIPLAFWVQKSFSFRSGQTDRSAMVIYGATQIGSLAVVSAVTSRFVTRDFLYDTALFLVTAGTAAVVSFLICRFVIFKQGSDAQ